MITKTQLGRCTFHDNVITNVDISDDIKNIYDHINIQDYTAFEVYPTYNNISAGTVSDIKTIAYNYETGRNYSVGEIIFKNDVFYTCKKTIDKTQTVIPTVTDGWEEYWDEGSEHEQDGLYLKYAVDVPACHTLQIQFYTHQKEKNDNDIVIDWGDGEITEIAKSSVIYQDYSDQGYIYAGFVVSHNYSEEGKFIVKVFGKDYFMLRCSPMSFANNIVSRIFDRDLPVASCLKNISSLARNALKLLKVEIPYGYNFKNISNWSNLFQDCYNLKKFSQSGGLMSVKPYSYDGMFGHCTALESNINNIIKIFQPVSELDGYKSIFSMCGKLYGKVDGSRLWGNQELENRNLNTSSCFLKCSEEIQRQVPLSWGGLNTEIVNKPHRRINDGISQAKNQFKDIYEGLEKNGVIRETISSLDVFETKPGYAVYQNGDLADISSSSYKYFDVDNVVPGQKFRIQTTLGANLGICVYDHEYLVKSWNSDNRVQISGYSNIFSGIDAAYAVLSNEMSLEQLQETLLTATRDDPIHYFRTNYVEYSENIVFGGQVEITIPEGGTLLRISGRENRTFGISSIGYEYLDKPEQYQLSAATADSLGGIKIGYVQNGQNYPVQLSGQMAYVNVPWSDVAIESAWYDTSSKNIVIQFNSASKDEISVNVSDLVDVYKADGTTLELNGTTFSVKDNVFQPKGDYLSTDALNDYYNKSETSSSNQITDALSNIVESVEQLDILSKSKGRQYEMVELPSDYIKYGSYLYSDGKESNYSESQKQSYACTKFISITSSDIVEYTGHNRPATTPGNMYAVYDENFNCLSAYTPTEELVLGTYEIQLSDMFALYQSGILSAEPKYARFSMLGYKNSYKFKICKTNTPTYFSYIAKNIALKQDKQSEKIEFLASDCELSSYINSEGNITSGKSWVVSPLIKVDPFDTVNVYGYGQASGTTCRYLVAFYDETSAYIKDSGYPKPGSAVGDVLTTTVIAPKNAEFMRIGGYFTYGIPKCEILKSVHDQAINKVKDDLALLKKYSSKEGTAEEFIEPIGYIVDRQYIIASNGIQSGCNRSYACTNFMPIAKGDRFFYTGMVRASACCGYAIYDENKNFLSSYLVADGSEHLFRDYEVDATQLIEEYEALNTGKEIKYIRFSDLGKGVTPNLKVVRNNVTLPAVVLIDKINSSIEELSARNDSKNVLYGKNYLTFGDSYTAANFGEWTDPEGRTGQDSPLAYDSYNNQWKSYGWHIANRNAMTYTNKAVGGGTLTYAIYDTSISAPDPTGTPQLANSLVKDLTTEDTFAQLSGLIADADYITIAYGLNDLKKYDKHWNLCDVGQKTDSVISTMWGAWNTVLSTIYNLNPDVKLGIILTDGGFNADQRARQLSVASYWGIPVLDLKGDPQVPLMLGSSSNYGNRQEINPWIIQKKAEVFRMNDGDGHPNPYAHAYRSTVIENFLRSL